ncbi:MAG: CpsB/CapC family capsule biosynthesis tyrosine phosphatase [Thermodesulfobacteriota bacterium]
MIDLHCHILPGVDDGAADLPESIEMARQAVADGIHTVVATPHSLNDVYFNPLEKVIERVRNLRDVLRSEGLKLELCPGSDARICARMAERVAADEAATINLNGRYILAEFPSQVIPDESRNELFQLKLNNITPIITHPERNLVFQHRVDLLYDLVEMGSLIQITAMSITGELGEEAMACAHELLERRLVHVIASDAHSSQHRPPILSPAVEAAAHVIGDEKSARAMVTEWPAAILAGESVAVPEPRRKNRRKWWKIFG